MTISCALDWIVGFRLMSDSDLGEAAILLRVCVLKDDDNIITLR